MGWLTTEYLFKLQWSKLSTINGLIMWQWGKVINWLFDGVKKSWTLIVGNALSEAVFKLYKLKYFVCIIYFTGKLTLSGSKTILVYLNLKILSNWITFKPRKLFVCSFYRMFYIFDIQIQQRTTITTMDIVLSNTFDKDTKRINKHV